MINIQSYTIHTAFGLKQQIGTGQILLIEQNGQGGLNVWVASDGTGRYIDVFVYSGWAVVPDGSFILGSIAVTPPYQSNTANPMNTVYHVVATP